jgi:predicted nucleic acid-binding protein
MTLADLVTGEPVFVDANTFVYHFTAHHLFGPACSQFLLRIARQEVAGFTATHVLSEVAHRVMTTEASSLHKWSASGIVPRLKQNPDIVKSLANFRQAVEQIPQYGVQVSLKNRSGPSLPLLSCSAFPVLRGFGVLSPSSAARTHRPLSFRCPLPVFRLTTG